MLPMSRCSATTSAPTRSRSDRSISSTHAPCSCTSPMIPRSSGEWSRGSVRADGCCSKSRTSACGSPTPIPSGRRIRTPGIRLSRTDRSRAGERCSGQIHQFGLVDVGADAELDIIEAGTPLGRVLRPEHGRNRTARGRSRCPDRRTGHRSRRPPHQPRLPCLRLRPHRRLGSTPSNPVATRKIIALPPADETGLGQCSGVQAGANASRRSLARARTYARSVRRTRIGPLDHGSRASDDSRFSSRPTCLRTARPTVTTSLRG